MENSYNAASVCKLLNQVLPGDALSSFCSAHFLAVQKKIGPATPRLWKIQLLVDYCKKYDQFDQMLNYLSQGNTAEYDRLVALASQPSLPLETGGRPAREQVEIVFEGKFSDFTIELQLAAIQALANSLDISSEQVSVLKVQEGSIILQVEMPAPAVKRLVELYQDQDALIRDLGIQQVRTVTSGFVRSTGPDIVRKSGRIRRLGNRETDQLFTSAPTGLKQEGRAGSGQAQESSTMTYTNPVRLKSLTDTTNHFPRQTARSDVPPVTALEVLSGSLIELLGEPHSIEATGIPEPFLTSLALKILYFGGTLKGWQMAQAMRLHFSGVVEPILQTLRRHHLVQVTGGSNLNRASYQYLITDKGSGRARELLERNRYVGPCPVTLSHYIKVVKLQAGHRPIVKEGDVRRVLRGLVLPGEVIDRIGPAVNSFKSIFVYGPPGNGKTSIAKAIGRGLLPGNIMVPYALYESGQVITVFDRETHRPEVSEEAQLAESNGLDKRWVRCGPPVVVTGGELTLGDLDLQWSETNRYYEAPFQLKANGGMLLVDDFGRQQMRPKELLNRWIVPLEERLDFLTFHTGKKFGVPFETLIVFSTNIDPESLVDDAFLRRIRHKLGIDDPDEQQYYQIFANTCRARGIRFEKEAFVHLMREYYLKAGRPLRACHPRDLLDQVVDFAQYRDEPAEMSLDLIERAASSYFADFNIFGRG